MLHEPLRAVGRQSTLLHAVQHGGVSCMGVTNPSLALSGHARQFRAETLCSAKRGKGKGVRGPLPHGGWGRVLDFVLTHVLIALTMSAARSRGRHHALKKWRQQGGQGAGGAFAQCRCHPCQREGLTEVIVLTETCVLAVEERPSRCK